MLTADERALSCSTARSTTTASCAASWKAAGFAFRTNSDTEVLLHLYATMGEAMRRAAATACSRSPSVDRREAERCSPRPLREQAALLRRVGGTLAFASTTDPLGRSSRPSREVDPAAIACYLVPQYVPAPLTRLGRRPEAPARRTSRPGARARLEVRPYRSPPARDGSRPTRLDAGGCARARSRTDPGRGRRPSGERGSPRRVPLRRPGFLGRRGRGRRDAIRGWRRTRPGSSTPGSTSRATRGSSPIDSAPSTTNSLPTTTHPALFQEFDPRVRRAVRRLVDARDARRRQSGTRTRHGDPDRRRRRRAVRGLRTVLRVPNGASSPPGARSAGPASVPARSPVGGRVLRDHLAGGGASWVRDPWTSYRDALFHFAPGELAAPSCGPRCSTGSTWRRPRRALDELWAAAPGSASTLLWVDEQTYLPDDLLVKMDRATMAHSLEARSPLLDHRLAEFAAGLRGGPNCSTGGRRARRSCARRTGTRCRPEILQRDKMGFGIPLASWLRVELREIAEELLLSDSGPLWTWLRPDAVRPLVRRRLTATTRARGRPGTCSPSRVGPPSGTRPSRWPTTNACSSPSRTRRAPGSASPGSASRTSRSRSPRAC